MAAPVKFPRRSLLTGGAAIAALAATRDPADAANVPFTTFGFKSTGSITARTQPDRLAEVKNVLDFGADPTGATDSQAAIQAAVNWTGGPDRGVIFFPLGFYSIGSPITYNYNGPLSICFQGEVQGSFIAASGSGFNGFLFDRNNVNSGFRQQYRKGKIIFDKLNLSNGDASSVTSGCVRVGSAIGVQFRDCDFLGQQPGVTAEESPGVSAEKFMVVNCHFRRR